MNDTVRSWKEESQRPSSRESRPTPPVWGTAPEPEPATEPAPECVVCVDVQPNHVRRSMWRSSMPEVCCNSASEGCAVSVSPPAARDKEGGDEAAKGRPLARGSETEVERRCVGSNKL